MSNEIPPPPTAPTRSEPPAARTGRAIVDAVGDAVQNLAIIGIASYAWLVAEKIDTTWWVSIVGGVAGLMNTGSLLDRLLSKRVSRGSLTIVGAFVGSKIGGVAAAAEVAEVARRTLTILPIVLLCSCATLRDIKPVARDVNNIARELCEATMGAEAEKQGLPIREFCAISYIIAPFLEAQHLASANAKLGRELSVHECAP